MTSNRSTDSFGQRQEYITVAELLRRNYDVYITLVDDQQIDCILHQENGHLLPGMQKETAISID